MYTRPHRSRTPRSLALLIVALVAAFSQAGWGAAPHGVVDTTFDTDGSQTVDFGFDDHANGVVVQPDGKIVVVGFMQDFGLTVADFAVSRLNPDGSPDLSFSGDGRLEIDFELFALDYGQAVALQTDGKIVVAGSTQAGGPNENFGIARVNPNGTLDTTFDGDGLQILDFCTGCNDGAMGVAIQGDGKIVAAGYSNIFAVGMFYSSFAVARLNANGTPDATFGGGDGEFLFGVGGTEEVGRALALDEVGRIVIAGYSNSGGGSGPNNFAIARVTSSGSLDTFFDADGYRTIDFGFDDRATSVAIQTDGHIVVAGHDMGGTPFSSDFVVARLMPSGALDATFSGDGLATADLGGIDQSTGLAILHNGKIALGGSTISSTGAYDFGFGVLNPDGTPDTTFDIDGELVVVGEGDESRGMAVQPDGQLVLVGSVDVGGGPDNFAILRVGADPPADLTFDADGRQTSNFGPLDEGNDLLIQPDGKVVVAGSADDTVTASNFAISRYNADGSHDTSFDTDGRLIVGFGGTEFANAVARQVDGKLVVAGYTNQGPGAGANNFAVLRLNTNGSLDTTFNPSAAPTASNGNGRLTIDFGFDDRATGVVIQPDGKIIIGGFTAGLVTDFALARVNPDGTLDTTFSTDGKFSDTFAGGVSASVAEALALQSDGNIVIAGYTTGGLGDFGIARVTAAGVLDVTFDTDGRQTTTILFADRIQAIAIQADGKIVAAGSFGGIGSDTNAAVARYNTNGSLDTTFSGDGLQTVAFGGLNAPREFARGVALQANGKIVVAGFSDASTGNALGPNDFAIARLNTDGGLDTSFNAAGRLLIDFGNDDRGNAVEIVPATGAIVVAGTTSHGMDFATVRLPGDAPPPLPTLTVNDISVAEGNAGVAAATFTLNLSAASTFPVSVDVATADGSAVAPGDYTAIPLTAVQFPPGTTSRTVTVSVSGDLVDEPVESYFLNLTNPGNATLADAQGVGTITDEDLTVTITSPTSDPATPGSVLYLVMGGTAADVTAGITSVTWVNDRGGSGTAAGTADWSIPEVPLAAGVNVITVTARDVAGNTTTDTLTVTVETLVYYLAEGATGGFFDYDLLLANPTATPAPVSTTFLKDDGTTAVDARVLPPMSRTTIRVDDLPGLGSTAVSAVVTSTAAVPIIVERSMYWDAGYYGGHAGSSVPSPDTTWLFGEGSQGFFDTYVLLANANAAPATVTVTFLLEAGAPVVKVYAVAPTSRFNVYAGGIPELVNKSFSIVVTSTIPIIAERAMYFGTPLFNGGHESAGVNAASTTWFHAEGATGPYFDTYILVGNPNAGAATVTMTFLLSTGTSITKVKTIPGNTRLTVNVELEDPQLADAAVSATVTSNIPVISERAMYWPGPFTSWFEAHNSFGVTQTSTKWGLAEGRSGGPNSFQTYILLANPSTTTAADVRITYLKTDGTTVVKTYTVNPTSRFNVDVNAVVPELAGLQFGALIEVTNGVAIAVERALYNNAGGVVWAAGTNATAVRVP